MPPLIQALLIFVPFLIIVAACSLYFSGYPERQARVRRWISGSVMSSDAARLHAHSPVADRLPATSPNDGQGIAKPGNAVNAELPGNALPEQLRAIVRFQSKVEAVIAIVESGKVGQTEAIERIFECKRSGRADSVYSRAHAAVVAQMGPVKPEYVGDMIERVRREVEQA